MSLRHVGALGLMLAAALAGAAGGEGKKEKEKAKKKPAGLRLVREIDAHPHPKYKGVFSVEFSPDGQRLLSAGNFAVRLWDPATGKIRGEITAAKTQYFCAAFAAAGRSIACAAGSGPKRRVDVVDAKTLKHIESHSTGTEYIWSLAGSRANKLLAVGTHGSTRLLDATNGKAVKHTKLGQGANATILSFNPDGKSLAVVIERETQVRFYSVRTHKETGRIPFPKRSGHTPARALAFHPGGGVLAIGMDSYSIVAVWDARGGMLLREIDFYTPFDWRVDDGKPPPRGVSAVCFSPDGRTLLAACRDGKLRMWELATGRVRHEAEIMAYRLAMAPNGSLLATASVEESAVRLWDWRDTGVKRPELNAQRLARLWADLASEDSKAAFGAVNALVAAPKEALALLGKQLRRVEPVKKGQLEQLIVGLDADTQAERKRAYEQLEALGRVAEGALGKAKAKSASAEARRSATRLLARLAKLSAEELRAQRAVEALEAIGTKEARRVLQSLAGGAARAVLTEEAKAALKRRAGGKDSARPD